jgi:hypothetical protein
MGMDFSPLSALVGGAMIGAAAVLLLATIGRIAGISGILGGALVLRRADLAWRAAFIVGLVAAPAIYALASGKPVTIEVAPSLPLLIAGGVLVGFGTRLGGGCTSGHGVCGMARLAPRSFVAVGVFLAVAIATVFIVRRLGAI